MRHRQRAPLKTLTPKVATADTRVARPPPKTADAFYTSSAWRLFVTAVKRERGMRCEQCGNTEDRIIGDHIHELKDGGAPLDRANIRLLCQPCHNVKTAEARSRRLGSPVR